MSPILIALLAGCGGDPAPDWTLAGAVAPTVAALDAEEQVLVVNAPGFGDVRAEVDALARQAMEHLDVVVYVLNADGGATIDERRDLDAIRARAGVRMSPLSTGM